MRLILIAALAASLHAAIPANAIWNIRSDATASNVNGGFFNTGNANFPTDGTVDTNTGNTDSPVFSSASYNFVAGDVGAWIYVKSGTNTYPGFYQIASVASNKATLSAAVGAGVWHNQTNRTYTASTSAGIASVGTPTSITWGINYAWQTAANNSTTNDLASSNGTTNPCAVTSAGSPFGINHTGNGLKVASGTNWTATWYEVVSVSGVTATLDKACGSAASISSGVFRVGGALSLGSLDDAVFEMGIAGNDFLIKIGSYTIGGTVSLSATGGSSNPIRVIGYNSLVGDTPTRTTGTTDNRPQINLSTTSSIWAANWDFYNMRFTGSSTTTMFTAGTAAKIINCQFINSSTTANAVALSTATDGTVQSSELVSYRGRALNLGNGTVQSVVGNYIHSSNEGIYGANNQSYFITGNVIEDIVTHGIYLNAAATGATIIYGNTIAGAPTPRASSVGVRFATGITDVRLMSNIFSGWAIGVQHADSQSIGLDYYNFYYGNTADTSNWALGSGSATGTNPSFTGFTMINGTAATSTTNELTAGSGTPFGGVVDNVDFVYLSSGSGTGFATGLYLITSHTDTKITLSSNITSSGPGSSIVWDIVQGHDLSIGTALKALGMPRRFGGYTTNFLDPGAAQRQEAGGGGTRIF